MKKLRDVLLSFLFSSSLGFGFLLTSEYVRTTVTTADHDRILGLTYLGILVLLGLLSRLGGWIFNRKDIEAAEDTTFIMAITSTVMISVFTIIEGDYEPKTIWPVIGFLSLFCSFFFIMFSVFLFKKRP